MATPGGDEFNTTIEEKETPPIKIDFLKTLILQNNTVQQLIKFS